MRINEQLLDPDNVGPWPEIAKSCSRRYRSKTGCPFNGEMLEIAATVRSRPDQLDRVAWGFARRAVAQMRATCMDCGSRAKPALGRYRSIVRCEDCQLPIAFRQQLEHLLRDEDPAGEPTALWTASQLPPLIRIAVPQHTWRQLTLTSANRLHYLAERDLQALLPRLTLIANLLEEDASKRILVRRRGFVDANRGARS
jgi:hypothetical protein